ncbi:hypothetical protein VBD025_00890 [Virgibacillus flavescens]|uniref:hypothetical protein n=1 Tax=Virgibacillus flavescens TaxID=1611422 RepID=UPI003D329017
MKLERIFSTDKISIQQLLQSIIDNQIDSALISDYYSSKVNTATSHEPRKD